MVTHSTKAASRANRVLFIKDGVVFHQIYKGSMTDDSMYTKISDTLTALATGVIILSKMLFPKMAVSNIRKIRSFMCHI